MNRYTRRRYGAHLLPLALLAAIAVSTGAAWLPADFGGWPAAFAEEGHGGGHSGGSHGGGHAGRGGGGGHDSGHEDSGEDHGGGHAGGQRGHGSQGTHRGGHGHDVARGGGKAVEYRVLRGRRPVWAQEGIPEVELGRLNVSRAPGRVLAHAEEEALASYSGAMVQLYNLDADSAAALLRSHFAEVSRYDSPLQNLALYKDVMIFGSSRLSEVDPQLQPASRIDLAAIFLGSASDKTIPVSEDTVVALNRILGLVELDAQERSALANKAETVRAAILAGHGPTEDH